MSRINMALKHLANGTKWPPLEPGTLRLYSMHFCPYAQRTRLVLEHKKIPHETVNVNLKYKPDWFLARNPLGLVPVIEWNDNVVSDSLVCGDLLEELYPQSPLYPHDTFLRAKQKTIMVQFEGLASDFGTLKSRNPERKEKGFKRYLKRITIFEDLLTNTYYAGSSPGMVDFHIWPWFERLPALQKLTGMSILPREKYPKLNAWMEAMLEVPAVKAILISDELHMKFFVSFGTGEPNYDAAFQAQL